MRAGFTILGGIDADSDAILTAKHNMPDAVWEHNKIEELSSVVRKDKKHLIHRADIILAGLPCQGFSVAGERDPKDHRNMLYKYLLQIVKCTMPPIVLLENVQGIASDRNKLVFSRIREGFQGMGYEVSYRVYDAKNFGTPQKRKRVFILATRAVHPDEIFERIRFSNELKSVAEALIGLNAKFENVKANHTFMDHSEKVKKKIRRIQNAQIISYRRLKSSQPSLTITSGHNALPLHPTQHRAISNREAARLQGIPDTFIFQGSRTNQTVQVANAVPLPVVTEIASAIKRVGNNRIPEDGPLFKKLSQRSSRQSRDKMRQGFVQFYNNHGIHYPWRQLKNPRHTLIAEILLQRTNGKLVNGQWSKLISGIKTSKGEMRIDKRVLRGVIQKLGLFNKINVITKVLSMLHQYFDNKLPTNHDELTQLPGVGIYIASAVRTFAFDIPDFPVDSNAFRFVGRYFGLKIHRKKSEARQIRKFMNEIIDLKKPKQFAYGFLDYCSSVCSPKTPSCDKCFLKSTCKFYSKQAAIFR
jgi:DNA (cytosine-5)-methyltransferase 1